MYPHVQATERSLVLPMITCTQIERPDAIRSMRDDYLRTLAAPMDGMWEGAVIAHATFWEIQDRGRHAGHFCVGLENDLLRFHLTEDDQARAGATFRWIVATYGIHRAIASTIEPLFFSLCLDLQVGVAPHSDLFRDGKRVERSPALGDGVVRKVGASELDDLARFYRANTGGSGGWIEAFLRERLAHEELFGLYDRQTLIATGECIPSREQPPYADLGMVVARSHRGRGLGSAMLIHMKEHCYEAGWEPICSCAADNGASKKAIERAGFVGEGRRVTISFSRDRRTKIPR